MKINDTNSNLLSHLIILSGLFFLLQLILVLGEVSSYLEVSNVQSNAMIHELFTSRVMVLPLMQLLFYQLLIYGLYVGAIYILALLVGERFNASRLAVYYLGIFLFLIATIAVVIANNIFFPHSIFAFSYLLSASPSLKILLFMLAPLAVILGVAVCLAFTQAIKKISQKEFQVSHVVLVGVTMALLEMATMNYFSRAPRQWLVANSNRPNIILIGIDGVRPDFVNNNLVAPNINAFLKSSVNFTNTYTPIAQTFPAWVSILTSMGPKSNGVRENLPWLGATNISETLPGRLQAIGYETIFATDDPRFITIKKNVGFDRLVTPKSGVAEFIIGAFNDFPLTNWLITTAAGKWLFPYNYANHEAQVTYLPKNFIGMLNDTLEHPADKPLFLAVHFNVSGWPFGWARSQHDYTGPWYNRYVDGVQEADNQFGQFLKLLSQHHLLKNSVVVLLSDHGVTLGLPHDRAISETEYEGQHPDFQQLEKTVYLPQLALKKRNGLDTSYGYGGDLLSLKQNHVLLAFKGYDFSLPVSQRVPRQSSLLDVAPTILELLKLPPMRQAMGVTLMSALTKKNDNAEPLYLETSSVSTIGIPDEPLIRAQLGDNVNYYAFDPVNNMMYKQPAAARDQLAGKQYAVLAGDWLLVQLPGRDRVKLVTNPDDAKTGVLQHLRGPAFMVLLNTATGKWTMELTSDWARATPVKDLCNKLFTFYGDDFSCVDCCKPFLSSGKNAIPNQVPNMPQVIK
jgi:hypothetical protein